MALFQHKPNAYRTRNINQEHDNILSFGDRLADRIANGIGSWTFIVIQAIVLIIWFWLNTVAWFYHWDGYPFILCNLFMSAEAAFSAPVIMMSQNRQSAKDRLTADHDYQINLKGEEETRQVYMHLYEQDKELMEQTKMLIKLVKHLIEQKEQS